MVENEVFARKYRIDPALVKAGWDIAAPQVVGLEIPIDGYDAEPWNGITDYSLYQPNGEIIAVVEAKRQSRHPNVAREQARHYVTEIAKQQSFQPRRDADVWKSNWCEASATFGCQLRDRLRDAAINHDTRN
jgi:type I site-specific restriction endonuclease